MQNDADKLIEIFSRIFPKSSGIPLHEPSFTGNEENMSMIALKVVGFHP